MLAGRSLRTLLQNVEPSIRRSIEYVVYIFCGLVPYLATAEAMSTGVTSVLTNKSVLNNTVFPIDLAPVKAALSAQAIMIAGLAVVLAGALLTGNAHGTLVLLPAIWALQIVWLIGVRAGSRGRRARRGG